MKLRNFIWGCQPNGHGFHAISWEILTLPKAYGGLGFKRLSSFNQACGAKLAWNLIVGSKGLWAELLNCKYMMRNEEDLLTALTSDSPLWKFTCQQKTIVEDGTKWQIRNGQAVNFFTDYWLFPDKKIEDMCLRAISEEEGRSYVADWVAHGSWDYSKLATIVSGGVMQRLITQFPPKPGAGCDIMMWSSTNDGSFSIKSAYFQLENNPPQLYSVVFNYIWRWKGVERIRVFMWLVFNNKLATNVWRSRWSLTSPLCAYCNEVAEDIVHILGDCSYATTFYSQFFSSSLPDWVAINLKRQMGRFRELDWDLLWGVYLEAMDLEE